MTPQQMAARVQQLSSQIHSLEQNIDHRCILRDQALDRANSLENWLLTQATNHPHAAAARVSLIQAQNVVRESDVHIRNGQNQMASLTQQRYQLQANLQRVQWNAYNARVVQLNHNARAVARR